jgi:hypothetical protein
MLKEKSKSTYSWNFMKEFKHMAKLNSEDEELEAMFFEEVEARNRGVRVFVA